MIDLSHLDYHSAETLILKAGCLASTALTVLTLLCIKVKQLKHHLAAEEPGSGSAPAVSQKRGQRKKR